MGPPVAKKKAKTFLTSFVTFLVPLILIGFPTLLSVLSGGWTAKYISNPNLFTISKIPDLSNKVAIVTGGNTGLGYETALRLVLNGAEVVLTARSKEKGNAAVQRIVEAVAEAYPQATEVRVKAMVLDLSSLLSVKKFVKAFRKLKVPLHMLILNAGIMKSPGAEFVGKEYSYGFELTKDGFESHIGVNHIAHHYLATQLTKELKAAAAAEGEGSVGARVISVSSAAEFGGYPEGIIFDTWRPSSEGAAATATPEWYEDGKAYSQSKLANVLFAREFAKRMSGSGVAAYSVHPGIIMTDLPRYMAEQAAKDMEDKNPLVKFANSVLGALYSQACASVRDGALNQLYVATAPANDLVNGGFYWPVGKLVEGGSKHAQGGNETLQELLWNETERVIGDVWAKDAEAARAAKKEAQADKKEETGSAAKEE